MADFNKRKVQAADFQGNNIQSIDGTTVVGQADLLKKQFDKSTEKVIAPKLNGLIDDLQNETAATQIGAPALISNGAKTVAEQLLFLLGEVNYLASEIKKAVAGTIADGSVTDEKLSNEEGQIKQRLVELNAVKASIESPAFTGTPTAPTAAYGDSSEQIANTAFCEELVKPMNTHILNGDVHVTPSLKDKWDGHVADESIHVSEKEKVAWDDVADKVGSTVYSITDGAGSSASWVQGGVQSVPNINKYNLYLVDISGSETKLICTREGTRIRGGNMFTTSAGVTYIENVSMTIAGTDVTFVKHSIKKISSNNVLSDADAGTPAISAIYGIL